MDYIVDLTYFPSNIIPDAGKHIKLTVIIVVHWLKQRRLILPLLGQGTIIFLWMLQLIQMPPLQNQTEKCVLSLQISRN